MTQANISIEANDREPKGYPPHVNNENRRNRNSSSREEDQLLIDRIRIENDTDAFAELVANYQHKVWRLARGITRSDEDAEDVMQEVFLIVFRKLQTFEGRSSFSSWLYRIAANASYMKLRSRKPMQFYDPDDIEFLGCRDGLHYNSFERTHDPEELTGSKMTLEFINSAIETLPEKYRTVLILSDIQEFSSREIADMLGLKVAAVKSRLHRARLCMREKLARLFETEIINNGRPYFNFGRSIPRREVGMCRH